MASPRLLIPAGLLLGLILPAAILAQSITLSVDTTQTVRLVDERVFGLNTAVWDNSFKNSQTLPLLQAIDPRVLRFPGGSTSDTYVWQSNKSYISGTLALNNFTWSNSFDDFATVATALQAQVFITVNYGSATAQDAADWVTYSNGTKHYGFKYWEIGNENYGAWEYDTHASKWDPVTYATAAKDFISRMKAADPTIKIGVVAETGEDNLDALSPVHNVPNPRTGVMHHGWTPVMLATLKSLGVTPDFLIFHRYDQAPGAESDAVLLQSAKTWPTDAANLRQQLNDYLGPVEGPKVELTVTENNSVYSNPGRQTTSVVNALFLADSLGNLLQTEFNSLVWWGLHNSQETNNNSSALYGWRNYGDYGVLSPTNERYPTYYMMKLLANFARGGDTVVRATSASTSLAIFAVKRPNGTLGLLVINKDPTNTLNASIALTGYTPAASASVYSYGIPQDNAAKPGGSGSADMATSFMNISGPTFAASFGPYSATVISLGAGSGTTAPPPPMTPAPTPSGGGGGGAISDWFLAALTLMGIARWIGFRRGI